MANVQYTKLVFVTTFRSGERDFILGVSAVESDDTRADKPV